MNCLWGSRKVKSSGKIEIVAATIAFSHCRPRSLERVMSIK